ncbi:MAG: helix-turn-helix domain-containing protein [Prevotella sp.]
MNELPFMYFSTKDGEYRPDEFHYNYHVHILVTGGEMRFSDGRNYYRSQKDDLVIWQMSNNIQNVDYSDDFQAEWFVGSSNFVKTNNPEMSWATMGFVFIRKNPSYHLEGEALDLMQSDFRALRERYGRKEEMFKAEVLGNLFCVFLYDLWQVYNSQIRQQKTDDNSSQIFLHFTELVQRECKKERLVAHYADQLCITPKYLNQVCNRVTNISASEWIAYYVNYELIRLLNDPSKPLADIAFEMNFSSNSFFTRYTKKHLGMTPSEFRKRHNK